MQEVSGSVSRALLSVSNKEGLVEFAQGLHDFGIALVASGGTGRVLKEAGVPVTSVTEFTGANEVLEGRVKTLHPRVHAGILCDRRKPGHLEEMKKEGYETIDMVVCNLYPFQKVLEQGAERDVMVENIDIGGPTLVRAAAKNADGGVSIVVDPSDYEALLKELQATKSVSVAMRRRFATKAFRHVAEYDELIASYYEREQQEEGHDLPVSIPAATRVQVLRYGENPHQQGGLYLVGGESNGVAHGTLLAGKPLSYNNLLDMDGAYRSAYVLARPGCAIVKHTNPCGLAEADTQANAFKRALEGDPVSAFGSIIGFNTVLAGEAAEAIRESKLFVECIVAPGFSDEAREVFAKRENLRLVEVPMNDPAPRWSAHRIGGGMLVQQTDSGIGDPSSWSVVTAKPLEDGWRDELAFAMKATMTLKSNSIAVTRGRMMLGAGAGFMSRIDAVNQAIAKAENAQGAFLGSDAFFPFRDSIDIAAAAGIVAVAQPGGSKRDDEVIEACNDHGIAMVFTGRRHFRH
ncbi:MAG: bifunctional phosphoribosylaminoimidazolecarboxamide formyltransferase/IMP cyclohydrolase [Myxococcota bacterium]